MIYKVLIPVRSDKSGKRYDVGEVLVGDEFPKYIINDWCKSDPPVLLQIEDEEEEE